MTQLDRGPDWPNDPPTWVVDEDGMHCRGRRVGRVTLERYWCVFRVGAGWWMAGYYDDSAEAMGKCFNLEDDGSLVLAPGGAKYRSIEAGKAAVEAFELNPPAPAPTCGGCGQKIPNWKTHRYTCHAGGYATCFPSYETMREELSDGPT